MVKTWITQVSLGYLRVSLSYVSIDLLFSYSLPIFYYIYLQDMFVDFFFFFIFIMRVCMFVVSVFELHPRQV